MTATTSNAGPAPDALLWVQLEDGYRYENIGDSRLRRLTADDLPWLREEEP
jgi:hypothetical protein